MSFIRRTSLKVDDGDVLMIDPDAKYGTPPPKPIKIEVTEDEDFVECSLTGRMYADLIIQQCLDERKLTMSNLNALYRDLFTKNGPLISKCIGTLQELFDIQPANESQLKKADVLPEVRRILHALLGKRCLLFYRPSYDDKIAEGQFSLPSTLMTAGRHPYTLQGNIDSKSEYGDTYEALPQPATHLTMWAILVDIPHMVIDLLRTTEFPIGLLLLSAAQYKAMSRLSRDFDSTVSVLWLRRSRALEKAAYDMMTALNVRDHHAALLAVGDAMDIMDTGLRGQKSANKKLFEGLDDLALVSPLELATEYGLQEFLTHPCVLAFLRKKFYNEIHSGPRSWVFLPFFWIPPLPVILRRPLRLIRYETGKYLASPRDTWGRRSRDSLFVKFASAISPSPIAANLPPVRCECCCHSGCCEGSRSRIYYTAPINIFQYYMLSTLGLICLLVYSLLSDFHLEWMAALWMLTFAINDLQQMIASAGRSPLQGFSWTEKKHMANEHEFSPIDRYRILMDSKIGKAVSDWFMEEWNLLDLSAYALFLLGLITHYSSQGGAGPAKAVYALCVLLLALKLFRFVMLSRSLAKVVIGIYLIAKSIVPVLAILMCLSAAFGIASFIVLHPGYASGADETNSRRGFLAFARPFWYIFGVIQLQEMQKDMQASANLSCNQENFDMFDPDTWGRCYTGWLATFLAALFLVIVHLVLITYLIGMVSTRYRETRSATQRIWCIQISRLVDWTSRLPLPPPPLNILWLGLRLVALIPVLLLVVLGWILRVTGEGSAGKELPSKYPRWSSCYQWFLEKLWLVCRRDIKTYSRPNWEKRKILLDDVLPNFDFTATYRQIEDPYRRKRIIPETTVEKY